jgi:hypothetical protein
MSHPSSPLLVNKFNYPDADVILLSQRPDATEFRVHRCILAAASPFFRDMFTLPQPSSSEPRSKEHTPLPIIPVTEDHTTLELLLRFVYPIPDPIITSLASLSLVLGAALKYDLVLPVCRLRRLLLSPCFVQHEPTRVFAIACRYDLEEEAKVASRYTLAVNILDCPLSDELKHITAFSYHRLLDLHRRRSKAAQDLLQVSNDVKCMQCNGSSYGVFLPPKWWTEFEKLAREELSVRPTTDVIFAMKFLAKIADAANCQRCPGSILDSHKFLEELKGRIDELPSTI